MRRVITVLGWMIAIATGFAAMAFFLALYVIACRYVPSGHEGDLGTWTGAIFAGAAFFGTIWIATGSARATKKEKLDKAMLTLAGMHVRLFAINVQFSVLRTAIMRGLLDDPNSPWRPHVFRYMHNKGLWELSELEDLIVLDRNLAIDLAKAIGSIRFLEKHMGSEQEFLSVIDQNLLNNVFRNDVLHIWAVTARAMTYLEENGSSRQWSVV